MTKEELYQQHLDAMYSMNVDMCPDKKVEEIFARLLQCLPNDGKLYKYRSIERESFLYALDGLQNNYLWMAKASSLNDDLDCSIRFDPIKDIEKGRQMFLEEPWRYFDYWLRRNSDRKFYTTPIEKFRFQKAVACVDKTTWQLDENKAVDALEESGIPRVRAKKYIADLLQWIKKTINKCSDNLKEPLSALMKFNENNRQNIYVFSMTETYDSDTMWGLYANSNRGFCIEYNFWKAQSLPIKVKRKLCNLFRMIYVDKVQEFSFAKLDRYFFHEFQDKELYVEINKELLSQLLSKEIGWRNEKEWRLLEFELTDNRLYADLVSGLIIDERVIQTENAKTLIRLAKKRGWGIKVRKMNVLGTKHFYEEYSA